MWQRGGSVRPMSDPAAPASDVWCIVVAGGSGRRWGGAKQFELLEGRRVIDRSVDAAREAGARVVAVVPADDEGAPVCDVPSADLVVVGGATRSESVRSGLAVVPAEATIMLVHDAARPLASEALFRRVIDAVRSGSEAVVPVVPVVDTIRSIYGGVVDRDSLRAVQTPQGFEASTLRRVHSDLPDASDDAGLVEAVGVSVALVVGERRNLKLTDPADRVIASAWLAADSDDAADSSS